MSNWALQIISYVPGKTGRQWLDTLSSYGDWIWASAKRYPCIVLPLIWLIGGLIVVVVLTSACAAIRRCAVDTAQQSQANERVQRSTPAPDEPNVPGP